MLRLGIDVVKSEHMHLEQEDDPVRHPQNRSDCRGPTSMKIDPAFADFSVEDFDALVRYNRPYRNGGFRRAVLAWPTRGPEPHSGL